MVVTSDLDTHKFDSPKLKGLISNTLLASEVDLVQSKYSR